MRSDPADYTLTAAPTLADALEQMAAAPGRFTPIAGGTELMVAFGSGRLGARSLLSIQQLPELRFIQVEADAVHIGAGVTFTAIRQHETLHRELPLLTKAASWTGSIANQNRGTVGGNLCNGSPAADTPPALLAYDASVTLISRAGKRTLPYRAFHLGYKRTALRPEELLYSVSIPRRFAHSQQSIRKVGTRNAQAISKTALAAVGRVEDGRIVEIGLGAASLADRPLCLAATEAALLGASLTAEREATIRRARAALAAEAAPIDDIRSTALYRTAVAANLLEEFLRQLAQSASD